VTEDNPVRVVKVFIDELDLGALGFAGVVPEARGRPAYTSPRRRHSAITRSSFHTASVMMGHQRDWRECLLADALPTNLLPL
jgi:hypothetical protein